MNLFAILANTPVEDGIQKKVSCFPSVYSLLFLVKKLKIFIVYQLGLVFGNEICQKSKLKSVQVAFWKFLISTGLWLKGEHLRVDARPNLGSRSGRPSESHNWTIVFPPYFLIFFCIFYPLWSHLVNSGSTNPFERNGSEPALGAGQATGRWVVGSTAEGV